MDDTREMTLTGDDIEALASKLDTLDLNDEEKALMLAVFELAGEALAEQADDEVAGFSHLQPSLTLQSFPGSLSGGFMESFSVGTAAARGGGPKVEGSLTVKVSGGGK